MREYEGKKSTFCNAKTALRDLELIVKTARYKYLVMSYNSEGPGDVAHISSYAFSGWKIERIVLHSGIRSVGNDAFSCEAGFSVDIPDVQTLCNIDFADKRANPCFYAQEIRFGNVNMKAVVVPEDITQLKPYTFSGFRCVDRIVIPQEMAENYPEAFEECFAEVIYN